MRGKLAKQLRKLNQMLSKLSDIERGEYFYDEHHRRIIHPYQSRYRRLKRDYGVLKSGVQNL